MLRRSASLSDPCSAWAIRSAATGPGVGGLVGDHDHLARAGGEVDADAARNEQLRSGDVGIARADDAVDGGDRVGAEGERCDRLRAADRVDLVETELAGDDERDIDGFGVTTAMRLTPATSAGTAAMTSDEGAGSVPLGTQIPTASSGSQRRSETIPGAASTTVSAGR